MIFINLWQLINVKKTYVSRSFKYSGAKVSCSVAFNGNSKFCFKTLSFAKLSSLSVFWHPVWEERTVGLITFLVHQTMHLWANRMFSKKCNLFLRGITRFVFELVGWEKWNVPTLFFCYFVFYNLTDKIERGNVGII